MLDLALRKIVVNTEDVLIEGGREVPRLNRIVVAACVFKNPWIGETFVEDLRPVIHQQAPELGKILVPRLIDAVGDAKNIEAYGKTAVVGTMGEIEHGAGFIHTLRFANLLRQAIAAKNFMPFTNKRGAPGCSIDVPLAHIAREGARSHFVTASFMIADAPAADEIIVAIAASTSGRAHHRIGDRYEDMKAMGVDQTGQALKEPA